MMKDSYVYFDSRRARRGHPGMLHGERLFVRLALSRTLWVERDDGQKLLVDRDVCRSLRPCPIRGQQQALFL